MREAVRPAVDSSVGETRERKPEVRRPRGVCEVEVEGFAEWDRARRETRVQGTFRADDFR